MRSNYQTTTMMIYVPYTKQKPTRFISGSQGSTALSKDSANSLLDLNELNLHKILRQTNRRTNIKGLNLVLIVKPFDSAHSISLVNSSCCGSGCLRNYPCKKKSIQSKAMEHTEVTRAQSGNDCSIFFATQ